MHRSCQSTIVRNLYIVNGRAPFVTRFLPEDDGTAGCELDRECDREAHQRGQEQTIASEAIATSKVLFTADCGPSTSRVERPRS